MVSVPSKSFAVFFSALFIVLFLTSCGVISKKDQDSDNNPATNQASLEPASQYCLDNGGSISEEQTKTGKKFMCTFPDGAECETTSYFRGECLPGKTVGNVDEEAAIGIAEKFIISMLPSYRNNGKDLKFQNATKLDCSYCFDLSFTFSSKEKNITPPDSSMHTTVITIEKGLVKKAVTDGNQEKIE